MTKQIETAEAELSQEDIETVRWQEEHPDMWRMKVSEQPNAAHEPYEVDEAVLRENLKLTPAARFGCMGERLQAAQREGRYLFDESEESVLPYTVLTCP